MSGYYGNYGPPPMGYANYDPSQPPTQPYGQQNIGFAVDMPNNAPYYSPPQPGYNPYANQLPDPAYGTPYQPQNTGVAPPIGFDLGPPSTAPDNVSSGDFVTETKKQGEEAGFWTTDSSGCRVYNWYSDKSNNGPAGNYSYSSQKSSYSYGPSTNDSGSQGRKSPYSQNTSYSRGGLVGGGWSNSPDSSRGDSSNSYNKQRAPEPLVNNETNSRNSMDKDAKSGVELSKNDPTYKNKLDKLAALMTDVDDDEYDLSNMRKSNDLKN